MATNLLTPPHPLAHRKHNGVHKIGAKQNGSKARGAKLLQWIRTQSEGVGETFKREDQFWWGRRSLKLQTLNPLAKDGLRAWCSGAVVARWQVVKIATWRHVMVLPPWLKLVIRRCRFTGAIWRFVARKKKGWVVVWLQNYLFHIQMVKHIETLPHHIQTSSYLQSKTDSRAISLHQCIGANVLIQFSKEALHGVISILLKQMYCI